MSLVTVTSPLHALTPKVWWEGRLLWARTATALQAATLGSYSKEVVVDPDARLVTVRTKLLWLRTRTIEVPFDAISHIEYRHAGLATGWLGGLGTGGMRGVATDGVESYAVALSLRDRDEVHLFSFMGEDARQTGAVGVILGDSLVDVRGDQGERARSFVDSLMELTGKGLSSRSRPWKYRSR